MYAKIARQKRIIHRVIVFYLMLLILILIIRSDGDRSIFDMVYRRRVFIDKMVEYLLL
jgi:hypothetical protein